MRWEWMSGCSLHRYQIPVMAFWSNSKRRQECQELVTVEEGSREVGFMLPLGTCIEDGERIDTTHVHVHPFCHGAGPCECGSQGGFTLNFVFDYAHNVTTRQSTYQQVSNDAGPSPDHDVFVFWGIFMTEKFQWMKMWKRTQNLCVNMAWWIESNTLTLVLHKYWEPCNWRLTTYSCQHYLDLLSLEGRKRKQNTGTR